MRAYIKRALVAALVVVLASTLGVTAPVPAGAAASFVISSIAGTGTYSYSGDGGQATSAALSEATGITQDSAGNIYFAEPDDSRIRKINTSGVISTIAGTGTNGFSGDGGAATSAQIKIPSALTLDAAGNIYFADSGNARIRKITTGGIITTIAGTGTAGWAGDGGAATSAQLDNPSGLAFDSGGNLYFSDARQAVVRKISTTGIITTVAGNNTAGYSGDGAAATSATLNHPAGISFDASNNLYIVDTQNYRIRKVNTSGVISTFAGTGTPGYSGDGGVATGANIYPGGYLDSSLHWYDDQSGLVIDGVGNVYYADYNNNRVREITAGGIISTVAGNGAASDSGNGGSATAAGIYGPISIFLSNKGDLLIDADSYIRKVALLGAASATTTASVTIDPSLTFTVSAHSGACNGVTQSSGVTTGATSVALAHLASGSTVNAAQDLATSTNAGGGATIYLRDKAALSDGNGHTISDLSTTNTSPGAFANTSTGAFGYTTSDATLGTGTANRFTNPSAQWAGLTNVNAEVEYLSAPATKTVCVDYQVGAGASTAAASYAATVIYTALPTF